VETIWLQQDAPLDVDGQVVAKPVREVLARVDELQTNGAGNQRQGRKD
jgi:hypothetical protein